jgi:hypothetical protein
MAVITFWFFLNVIGCIYKQIPTGIEHDSFSSPLKLGSLLSPLLPDLDPSDDPFKVAQKINLGSCNSFAVIGAIS